MTPQAVFIYLFEFYFFKPLRQITVHSIKQHCALNENNMANISRQACEEF